MNTPLNVLIVDDDSDTATLAATLMHGAGHNVDVQIDSTKALSKMEAEPPALLLVDIMMPGIDGLELTRLVRKNAKLKDVKIIVVSAKAYEFDRKRAFEAGADGFIMKPINLETYSEQIARILEDKMSLTYWGVRGTLPVPGERALRYGGNTPCLTLEFTKDRLLIFDAGTGIKAFSNHLMRQGKPRLEAKILISHPHWDHINALPFFVPLYIPGNEFEIIGATHGDKTMRELIAAQMEDVYFPVTLKEFGARVFFRDLRQQKFSFGDINISTLLLSHPGYCLGYRVDYHGRSICYVTDNELYLDDSPFYNQRYVDDLTTFVDGADILITDCTYRDAEYTSKVGWGHSCVSKVTEWAHAAKVKELHLFHHDPDQDDAAIDLKLADAKAALTARGSTVTCIAPSEGTLFQI